MLKEIARSAIRPFNLIPLALFALALSGGFAVTRLGGTGDATARGELGLAEPIELGNGKYVVESGQAPKLQLNDPEPVAVSASTVETGEGFTFVVDDVKRNEDMVEVTYHTEGTLKGLAGVGRAITLVRPDGSRLYVGARSTRSFLGDPVTVQAPASEVDADARLLLPSAVRLVAEPVKVTLHEVAAGSWAGTIELDGEEVTISAVNEGGFVSVAVTGAEGGSAVLDGRLVDFRLARSGGAPLESYHGSASYPDAGDLAGPITTTFDFVSPVDLGSGDLVLEFGGYGQLLRSDWEVVLVD